MDTVYLLKRITIRSRLIQLSIKRLSIWDELIGRISIRILIHRKRDGKIYRKIMHMLPTDHWSCTWNWFVSRKPVRVSSYNGKKRNEMCKQKAIMEWPSNQLCNHRNYQIVIYVFSSSLISLFSVVSCAMCTDALGNWKVSHACLCGCCVHDTSLDNMNDFTRNISNEEQTVLYGVRVLDQKWTNNNECAT